jgi:hypothetical protein
MKFQFTLLTLLIVASLAAQNVSDCPVAVVLCDKNMALFAQTVGAGDIITELDDALCFNNGIPGLHNESNSTWLSWTCGQSGSLTFVITPLKQDDDIDFALYRLPNGLGNCAGKQMIRCNAAGASFPSPCMGPTGLSFNETDESEDAGCSDVDDNAFIAPIEMEAGAVYALGVNNYTPSGEGFTISFDGSGTFDCGAPLQYETIGNEKNIRLFPNPTNSFFRLDKAENVANIRILNLIGCEMRSFDATLGTTSYSLEGLAEGVYLVALRDKNGSVLKVLRVVKV